MDQRGGGRFAVGAGDADDFVPGLARPRESEQLDIADQRHPGLARPRRDRVGVERHAGGEDHAVEAREVDLQRIGDGGDGRNLFPGPGPAVPRRHVRAARMKRGDRRQAAASETENRIALAAKGRRENHRTFSVARPSSASTMETIQKRITTVDSDQPNCSK